MLLASRVRVDEPGRRKVKAKESELLTISTGNVRLENHRPTPLTMLMFRITIQKRKRREKVKFKVVWWYTKQGIIGES